MTGRKKRTARNRPKRRTGRDVPQRQDDARVVREQAVPAAARLTLASCIHGDGLSDRVVLAVLGLLVLVVFFPALQGGFVWDDVIFTDSQMISTWGGIGRIWFSPADGGLREEHYWPLVYTTLWLEHKLWGFHPLGYHVVNIVLHAVNTWLLYRILKALAVPAALLAAAVFAVHPVHVESVAWVIERKDVLSGLFYLTAVLVWLRYLQELRWSHFIATLGLTILGMLSKGIVVTLPVALLIVQWWQRGRLTMVDCKRVAPLFAVAVAMGGADFLYRKSLEAWAFDFSFVERLLMAARAPWFYLEKLLWPVDLAVLYPFWDLTGFVAWGYLIAGIVLMVALWMLRHRLGRGPLAGALFFVAMLSPVLGFFDHSYLKFSFAADRFQYLASIGPIVVVIGALFAAAPLLKRSGAQASVGIQIAVGVFALAMLLVLSVLSWRQTGLYKDNVTLYGHAAAHNPQSALVRYMFAGALRESDRADEAIAHFRLAEELDPADGARLYHRRAHALGTFGEVAFSSLKAQVNIHLEAERHEEVVAAGLRFLDRYPEHEDAPSVLAIVGSSLLTQGKHLEAEPYLREALKHTPDNAEALQNLAEVMRLQSRSAEALELFRAVLAIDGDMVLALIGVADALHRLGQNDEALATIDRALTIDPQSQNARIVRQQIVKAMR